MMKAFTGAEKLEQSEVISAGTFGTVYKRTVPPPTGHFAITLQEVAIKVYNKEIASDAGVTVDAMREIAVLRGLNHPNVVELRQALLTPNRLHMPWCILEFAEHGSLSHVLRARTAGTLDFQLTTQLKINLCRDLFAGLAYLHSCGLVHRDLKPGNLLVFDKEIEGMSAYVNNTRITNILSQQQ